MPNILNTIPLGNTGTGMSRKMISPSLATNQLNSTEVNEIKEIPLNLLALTVAYLDEETMLKFSRKKLAVIMDRFYPYHTSHHSMCKERMIRHIKCYLYFHGYGSFVIKKGVRK